MFINDIFHVERHFMFTVICVNVIEVEELQGNMNLTVFGSGYAGEVGCTIYSFFFYICWSYRMIALMLCYYSIAPSTYKDDISASAICHL